MMLLTFPQRYFRETTWRNQTPVELCYCEYFGHLFCFSVNSQQLCDALIVWRKPQIICHLCTSYLHSLVINVRFLLIQNVTKSVTMFLVVSQVLIWAQTNTACWNTCMWRLGPRNVLNIARESGLLEQSAIKMVVTITLYEDLEMYSFAFLQHTCIA